MKVALRCSHCDQLPQVNPLILPLSLMKSHAVTKYQVICPGCAEKFKEVPNTYFATFAWNSLNTAIDDWNSSVAIGNKLVKANDLQLQGMKS